MKIPIIDWYDNGMSYTMDVEPGVTMLVGQNGSGKTTVLTVLKNFAQKNGIPCFTFDNYTEGGKEAIRPPEPGMHGMDGKRVVTAILSSEGQRIRIAFEWLINSLREFLERNKDAETVFLLFDALDSGLSINGIRDIKEFFEFLAKHYRNIYLFNAVNAYEFAKGARCIIARTGEPITFDSYEEYADFICKEVT